MTPIRALQTLQKPQIEERRKRHEKISKICKLETAEPESVFQSCVLPRSFPFGVRNLYRSSGIGFDLGQPDQLQHVGIPRFRRSGKLAKVKIHNLNFDDIIEYYLVGSTEADPFQNKISDSSPIGKAIIGAKVGDNVTVRLPKGDMQIVILEISK